MLRICQYAKQALEPAAFGQFPTIKTTAYCSVRLICPDQTTLKARLSSVFRMLPYVDLQSMGNGASLYMQG